MDTGLQIQTKKEFHVWRWILAGIIVALMSAAAWWGYSWYTKGTPLPIPIAAAKGDTSISEADVSEADVESYNVDPDKPRYISLPTLGIGKTRVYPVGVTKQNILDTPRNINDAAWYNKSATPGMGYGAVLMDAHSGGISKDGVFANLHILKEGDQIKVERGDGKELTYAVVENKTVSLEEATTTGMKTMMQSADPSKEGLNLITCAGKWIPRLGQFDQRVMVRAVYAD